MQIYKKVNEKYRKKFNIIKPDLTIYVDAPVESTIDRMKKRDNIEFEEEYIYKLQKTIHKLYSKNLNKENIYMMKNELDKKTYNTQIYEIYKFLKEKYINEK